MHSRGFRRECRGNPRGNPPWKPISGRTMVKLKIRRVRQHSAWKQKRYTWCSLLKRPRSVAVLYRVPPFPGAVCYKDSPLSCPACMMVHLARLCSLVAVAPVVDDSTNFSGCSVSGRPPEARGGTSAQHPLPRLRALTLEAADCGSDRHARPPQQRAPASSALPRTKSGRVLLSGAPVGARSYSGHGLLRSRPL